MPNYKIVAGEPVEIPSPDATPGILDTLQPGEVKPEELEAEKEMKEQLEGLFQKDEAEEETEEEGEETEEGEEGEEGEEEAQEGAGEGQPPSASDKPKRRKKARRKKG